MARSDRPALDLVGRPRSLISSLDSRAGARTRRGRGSVGAFTRLPTRQPRGPLGQQAPGAYTGARGDEPGQRSIEAQDKADDFGCWVSAEPHRIARGRAARNVRPIQLGFLDCRHGRHKPRRCHRADRSNKAAAVRRQGHDQEPASLSTSPHSKRWLPSGSASNSCPQCSQAQATGVYDGIPPFSIPVESGGTLLMSVAQPAQAASPCDTSGTSPSRRAATNHPSATPDARARSARRRGPSAPRSARPADPSAQDRRTR
jgi:hypothetical protein